MTCAPTNNDVDDPQYKCVVDEESGAVSPYATDCSCLGFIWCTSDDCNGNQCVLSTMDMKKVRAKRRERSEQSGRCERSGARAWHNVVGAGLLARREGSEVRAKRRPCLA